MSVIDKKGKLFGKLNIIDLLAILLIVAVLALIGYKLTSNSGGLAGAGQKVVYTVEVKNVDAAVYESLQKEALPASSPQPTRCWTPTSPTSRAPRPTPTPPHAVGWQQRRPDPEPVPGRCL